MSIWHDITAALIAWLIPIVAAWIFSSVPKIRGWLSTHTQLTTLAITSVISSTIAALSIFIYQNTIQYKLDYTQNQVAELDKAVAKLSEVKIAAADFYIKAIPSHLQHSEMLCNNGDILISAACTNANGAQAAVGPRFFDRDGVRWASCDRYGGIEQNAEGQLICMKIQ